MKIAIDASKLTQNNRTGTHNYLYNVIKALAKLDSQNEYVAYFCSKPDPLFIKELFGSNPNFSHKVVEKVVSWTQVSLPITLAKDNIDILLSTWQTMPFIKLGTYKRVSVIHDLEFRTARRWSTAGTILLSDRVVAVSDATKQEIYKNIVIKDSKITVIYEGAPHDMFYPRSNEEVTSIRNKYGIKTDYILAVGTVLYRKNVPSMLQAFAKLKTVTPVTFVIAGTISEEYKKIRDLPKALGIEDQVKFLGYVPDSDLPALISGAKLLSYVSYSEGFGLPILESMLCNTPVVTSNVSSMPEVAGDAAYLVSPKSIDDISLAYSKVLYDNDLRQDMVRKGVTNSAKFTWATTAKALLNLFSEVR